MKCISWLLCAMLVVAGAASAADAPAKAKAADAPAKAKAAPAEPGAPAVESAKSAVDALDRECKFSAEQRAKILELATAEAAEMAAWQKANGDRLDAFLKARAAATELGADVLRQAGIADDVTQAAAFSRMRPAMEKATDDVRPALDEWVTLRAKHEQAIRAVLTPEQRVAWRAYTFYRAIMAALGGSAASDRGPKCRTLAQAAARDWVAVKAEGEEGVKAYRAVEKKLEADIRATLLTEDEKARGDALLLTQARQRDGSEGDGSLMIRECRMTDSQVAAVGTRVVARDKALDAWEKANRWKLMAMAGTVVAPEGQPTDRIVIGALLDEVNRIRTQAYVGLMDLMTQEQKVKWWLLQAYQEILALNAPSAKPTEAQSEKIRAAITAFSKATTAAAGDSEAAVKARQEAYRKLTDTVREVLGAGPGK